MRLGHSGVSKEISGEQSRAEVYSQSRVGGIRNNRFFSRQTFQQLSSPFMYLKILDKP
jgi:hypothetical protein